MDWKKIRLKYFSATRPVLDDFLGFLKVSLSRRNEQLVLCFTLMTVENYADKQYVTIV